jgi:hypothetical protein
VAVRETIGIMEEIDQVIERHGGWPDAFFSTPFEYGMEPPARRVAEPEG